MMGGLKPEAMYRAAPWPMALCLAGTPLLLTVASQQLAFDSGCCNCQGHPPKKKAPTFARVAANCAKARDGSIFSPIDAHERLSPEAALQPVRWISEGAP
jgi:hypothetical protein